ncbi:MAG: 3-dehydroquinate synthase [Candidatus Cloacimonetes bacterium]|nr:3-dehydroquinate synthase [Candidatus Cloacimonadota bacterium]
MDFSITSFHSITKALKQATAVIVDHKVAELYKNKLDFSEALLLHASEEEKTTKHLHYIYNYLLKRNVTREDIVLGIGGGITTDLSGYATATFKRGCKLELVPTTLLAMADAAIGSKTGINFAGIKNLIGAFYPARKIYINPAFLDTLPEENMLEGWAEIIKSSLISGGKLFHKLKSCPEPVDILSEIINIKSTICQADLYDKTSRRQLNLGHTFAHVIESVSDFKIRHGLAVAMGLRIAAKAARQMEMISEEYFLEIHQLMDLYNMPILPPQNSELMKAIRERGQTALEQDKKNVGSAITLVLPEGKCKVAIISGFSSAEVIRLMTSG